MKLTFIGAVHEVTGSCTLLEANGKNILIDCGMEQGPDAYVNQEIPVNIPQIDDVLLTHAHIDHSGLLPLLYAKGFRGQVYSTEATAALCEIMLRDSAHIQMFEAEWRNRKARRRGQDEAIPLYNMEDAYGIMGHFQDCSYNDTITIAEGISIRFINVGHLLGAASIEIWLEEDGIRKKVVFSGDIGRGNQPLISAPDYIKEADYVIIESTYGDRLHGEAPDYKKELAGIFKRCFDRGGNVVIPSFAVGRTQELLYYIRKIKEEGLVRGHENFPVYVDSPLAVDATHIFYDHMNEYMNAEIADMVSRGVNPIGFKGLTLSITSEESKAINYDMTPKVIISASGMCEAGRIKHHLKHNLWREENTILFVGYQAVGTLGRTILEGVPSVKLFGEEIEVAAEIRRMAGLSGHADRDGLLNWIQAFERKPQHIFVNHGEDKVCEIFRDHLCELGFKADAPYSGAQYDLAANECIREGVPVKRTVGEKKKASKGTTAYDRLLASGERLLQVIKRNEGGANKDLAKLMGQINALCDKWDR